MNNQVSRAVTLRKFNPGAMQTDEEIIQQFVVRKHQFNAVIEVLEENLSSESNQHLLIVAPRGRGKTMLLARVAAELRQNPKFSSQLLPVRFMEESMEVLCIADFWLECLLHLINALNVLHSERAEALRSTRSELSKIMDNKQLEQLARAAVLEVADELDYRLVLTIENLQDLASDTDKDFGWKLRKTLQTVPRIILVASATSHFEGLFDVDQPFFELFREIDLPPLNIKECQNLWQAATGMAIEEREIKPLKILTGGSPRLLIFIASFSRHHSMRQLMEELVTLIDDHTEYFRGHLDALPAKERRVYIAVLDLWQPATTREVAERARMEIRSTSSLLNRLVSRGAITTEQEGKTKYYCATERLHSIYYKLRREGNEASVVQGLVMFMTAFYTGDEFQVMATNLLEESREMPSLKQGVQLAMRNNKNARERLMTYMSFDDCQVALGGDTGACDWVEHHELLANEAFDKSDYTLAITHLDKIIVHFKETAELELQVRVAKALFNRAVVQTEQKHLDKAIEDYSELSNRFLDTNEISLLHVVVDALFNRAITYGQQNNIDDELKEYAEIVKRFSDSNDPTIQVSVANALNNRAAIQFEQNHFDKAIENNTILIKRFIDSVIPVIQEQVARAFFNNGASHAQQNNLEEAIKSYTHFINHFKNTCNPNILDHIVKSLFNNAIALQEQNKFDKARENYTALITRFIDSEESVQQEHVAKSFVNRSGILKQEDRLDEAIAGYTEVIDLFSSSDQPALLIAVSTSLFNTAMAMSKLGRKNEALENCNEVAKRFTNNTNEDIQQNVAKAVGLSVELSNEQSRNTSLYENWYKSFPIENTVSLRLFYGVTLYIFKLGIGETRLLKILQSDTNRAEKLQPLIVALKQESGEEVRAPAEVIEVAKDIRKAMHEVLEKTEN